MTAARKKRAAKRKPGRPTVYSDELAATICTRLAEGESLRKICADDTMPSKATVMCWLFEPIEDGDSKLEFRTQYDRARQAQAELMADEIVDIADDTSGDVTTHEDGGETVNHDHIARSRLRVDSRKWKVSKLLPKVYGDRLQHTGEGGGPIRVAPDLSKLSKEELDALERILGRASDA